MPASRRDFLVASAGLGLGSMLESRGIAWAEAPAPGRWFEKAYRRAVIDMHIPDWDEAFLSQFDAQTYVSMLERARAQSIVAYAHSHVGLFNYPTKVGKQHAGLKGRDIFGELVERCHGAKIAVVAYCSLVFDRWAADEHPDWRMKTPGGEPFGQGGRHGLSCPNSPYRDYVRAWTKELCSTYAIDGIRFDMTFWPGVCYCDHCQARFAKEVGGDMPRTVNWLDEKWMAFVRQREIWLAEFAASATRAARENRPGVTVEHQSSTLPGPWRFGAGRKLIEQMDFLQGDFYGDSWQGSFVRKLLEELTPNRPFGFETSFSIELADHTAMKSEPLIEAKASAAVSDAAAFIFIDAIDPIGTLNPRVYERMGKVFDSLMPLYAEIGGERVRDVAIYHSLESKFDFAANGKPVDSPEALTDAHTLAAVAAARRVIQAHLPLGIVARKSLPQFEGVKLLILPQVCVMDDEEIEAIRAWVRGGGNLLATGWTSLVEPSGRQRPDFGLADVYGVKLKKPSWTPWPHYIAPTAAGQDLFSPFSAKYPAFAKTIGLEVEAAPGAQVLATTTLPWPTEDPTRFSSIHSNPPWRPTERPEIVRHAFGKGQVVYAASPIETMDVLEHVTKGLITSLVPGATFEVRAPSSVEATMFHQPDRRRYLLSLINFQKDLPNIPVAGIEVGVRFPRGETRRVTELRSGAAQSVRREGDKTTWTAPMLETLAVFAIEYV